MPRKSVAIPSKLELRLLRLVLDTPETKAGIKSKLSLTEGQFKYASKNLQEAGYLFSRKILLEARNCKYRVTEAGRSYVRNKGN